MLLPQSVLPVVGIMEALKKSLREKARMTDEQRQAELLEWRRLAEQGGYTSAIPPRLDV